MLSELIINILKEKFATITWQLIVLSFVVLILPGVPLVYLFDMPTFYEASVVKIIFLSMGFCFLVFFFNFIIINFILHNFLKSYECDNIILKDKILIFKSTFAMGMSIAPIYLSLIIAYFNNYGFKIYSIFVLVFNIVLVLDMIILNYYNDRKTRKKDVRKKESKEIINN